MTDEQELQNQSLWEQITEGWNKFGESWVAAVLIWALPLSLVYSVLTINNVWHHMGEYGRYAFIQVDQQYDLIWADIAYYTAQVTSQSDIWEWLTAIFSIACLAVFARYGRRAIPLVVTYIFALIYWAPATGSPAIDPYDIENGEAIVFAPDYQLKAVLVAGLTLLLGAGALVLWDYFTERRINLTAIIASGVTVLLYLGIGIWTSFLHGKTTSGSIPATWDWFEPLMDLILVAFLPGILAVACACVITELSFRKAPNWLASVPLLVIFAAAVPFISHVSGLDLNTSDTGYPAPEYGTAQHLTYSVSVPGNKITVNNLLAHPQLEASMPELLNSKDPWHSKHLWPILVKLPDFMALKHTPLDSDLRYTFKLRESYPMQEQMLTALVSSVLGVQRPLSSNQQQQWIQLVQKQPTHFAEDISLLDQLILDGRKQKSLRLINHISTIRDSNKFRNPENATIYETVFENIDRSRLELFKRLKQRAKKLPSESQRATGSLIIKLLDLSGDPLTNTPVGMHYTTDLRYEESDSKQSTGKVVTTTSDLGQLGKFKRTDENGVAVFENLNTTSYGVTAVSGWPGSELSLGEVAVPTEPIPDPLPPGETTITLQQVPVGTWNSSRAGTGAITLNLSPEPEGTVHCVGKKCEELDLHELDPREERQLEPALSPPNKQSMNVWFVEKDDSGSPVQFWKPTGFKKTAGKAAKQADKDEGKTHGK